MFCFVTLVMFEFKYLQEGKLDASKNDRSLYSKLLEIGVTRSICLFSNLGSWEAVVPPLWGCTASDNIVTDDSYFIPQYPFIFYPTVLLVPFIPSPALRAKNDRVWGVP